MSESSTELVVQELSPMALVAELERSGALTMTSLRLPEGVSYEQYEALFGMWGKLHEMTCWVLGDLINYGDKVYGETYAQAAEATGLSEHTLSNYASVCSRIPRSRRRHELKFSVHAEVAYMPPAEQTKWLKTASENKWKRAELREALAPIRAPQVPEEPGEVSGNGSLEILPPAGEAHVCRCGVCGRTLDVE